MATHSGAQLRVPWPKGRPRLPRALPGKGRRIRTRSRSFHSDLLSADLPGRSPVDVAGRPSETVLEHLTQFDEVVSKLSSSDVVKGALEYIRDRMGVFRLSVALLDRRRIDFYILEGAPAGLVLQDDPFPLQDTILSRIFESGEALYRPDIASEPRSWARDAAVLKAGVKSAFLLPLVSSGVCFGTLNLASDRIDGFTEERRRTFALFAPRLSLALQNARLFEELRASEERYRSIFQSVPVAILEEDCSGVRKGVEELRTRGVGDLRAYAEEHPAFLRETALGIRLLSANPAALALFGAASPRSLAEHLRALLLAPESRAALEAGVLPIIEGTRSFECEMRSENVEGDRLDLLVRINLLERSGELEKLIISMLDLTRRKSVERALERRIEFDDLVNVLSTNFINLPTEEIEAGVKAALESIGRFVNVDRSYIFLFSEAGDRVQDVLAWYGEGIAADLSRWIHATGVDLPWFTGAVRRMESVVLSGIEDLPGEALRERKFLREHGVQSLVVCPLIYRGEPVGLIGLDTVSRQKKWAPDVLALLKLVGQIFVNALERKRAEEALRLVHEELERRVRDRTADLERAKAELEKDIAARKLAEAEKVQLERQLRGSRVLEAVGLLAGGVAHDFNNILGSVIGCLYIAKLHCPEDDPIREEIERAQALCKRGGELTRQLLTVARRRTGSIEAIDLTSVFEEVEVLLARTLPKNIRVSFQRTDRLPQVRGDRSMLTSALLNLGVNARDAMPHGGELRISAEKASRRRKGSWVVIEVSDSGTGIPESVQDRIFDPFFTTKSHGEGTGLGLSMVYATVAECGGKISVRSEPGAGSTFRVELPAAGPPLRSPVRREPQKLPKHPLTAAKILVVEDEENVARLVLQILGTSGYSALWAKTGITALETLRDHREEIGLVLLDLLLPDLGGQEVYRLLNDLTPEVPILLITGREDLARHLAPGRPLLPKPFTGQEFLESLTEALTAGRWQKRL